MSLIAWYPLNGDTLDYSGNENHATNYGATIDNNGKIGKCYSFDGIDDYIIFNEYTFEIGHTVVLWIDFTNVNSVSYFLSNKNNVDGIRYDGTNFSIWNGRSGFTTLNWQKINGFVHFSIKRLSLLEYEIYINGKSIGKLAMAGTASVKLNAIGKRSDGYFFNGKINDVRIYDHTLSDKEIKELAKARILHYSFDDFQEPTENLFSNFGIDLSCKTLTGYSSNQNVTLSIENMGNGKSSIKALSNQTTSTPGIKLATVNGLLPNTDYTFSAILESNVIAALYVSAPSVSSPFSIRTNPTKVSLTFNSGSNTTAKFYALMSTPTISTWIKANEFQLERKSYSTNFTLTSRQGIVRDISGYGNDAVLDSYTPRWMNDSKIGDGCYEFNGNNSYIKINTNYIHPSEHTISIWFYKSDWAIDGWENLFAASTNRYQIVTKSGTTNSPALRFYPVANTVSYDLNKWNHVVVIRKQDGTEKIYLNNELKVNLVNTSRVIPTGAWFIGGYSNGLAENFKGKIDDVRIYATALSEEDVRELYQTRMSIDNKGNISVNQLELNPINGCPSFEHWTLGGGAYVENDELVFPNYGATAISPFIYIGANPNWYWSADYFSATPKPNRTAEGGYLQGSAYYDINRISTLNTSGYSSNGNAGSYPINQWTRKSWKYVGGNEVRYLRINISSNSTYSASNYRVRNPMVTVNGMTSDYITYSSKEMVSSVPKFNLNERGILSCNDIYEVGMPIRYVRDTMNGSSANTNNHWVEIQAYNKHDVNVALGKSATSALLTDGNTATSPYYGLGGGTSVQVDLGDIYVVSYLKIWHYYADGRTYRDVKTEVSADGINWTTVFDSNIDGEYKETSSGNTILLRPQSFSIGASGEIFTNELKEV